MGDSLKKAQAGQKLEIPAEAYNAFLDAVRFVRERRHDVAQESTEPLRQSGIIKVRNKSGADRDRYDVLMIDDPIITPTDNEQQFKNQVAFEGYEPSEQAQPSEIRRRQCFARNSLSCSSRCQLTGLVVQRRLAATLRAAWSKIPRRADQVPAAKVHLARVPNPAAAKSSHPRRNTE